ncbi:MAG: CHAD domain-containing protein [bacterium]|nr:CHAD domain-containing protein [bacterium]
MSPKALHQHIATLHKAFIGHVASLQANDPEALHELRVGLRRLRTLLRPLSGKKSCQPLYDAATEVFHLSNPLRDLEVLLADLDTHGETRAAAVRRRKLQKSLQVFTQSDELAALGTVWEQWPETVTIKKLPGKRCLKKCFRQAITGQQKYLLRYLPKADADLHQLRIHIKHLRYFLEAYEAGRKSRVVLLERLCAAQNTLGEWHDVTCHLACAATENDLAASCTRWQFEQATTEEQLPALLKAVRKALATR